MRALTADEVVITFLRGDSGDPVMAIVARQKTQRVHPVELGLMDRRGGILNALGAFLLALASGRRQLHSDAKAQTVSRLRRALKKNLGIVDDPFERYRSGSGVGWEPRFKVHDKRGAADERAKREAGRGRRTTSIDGVPNDRVQLAAIRQRDFDSENDEAGTYINDADSSE